MTTTKFKNIVLIILICLTIGLGYYVFTQNDTINELNSLNTSVNSELVLQTNKLGEQTAKNRVIETQNIKMFTNLQNLSGVVKTLQEEVKRNRSKLNDVGSSVSVIEANTKISTSVPTSIIPVHTGDSISKYPKYQFKIDNMGKWVVGVGTADSQEAILDLTITNDYSLTIGSEKPKGLKNIFKPRVPYAYVHNFNPYTSTTELKTYRVSAPKHRFAVGPGIMYGFGPNFQFGFYVGVSAQYIIFKF